MVKETNINRIKEKLEVFFTGKPIKKAFLFDSAAKNETHQNSDIDILVELDSNQVIGMIEYIKMIDGLQSIFNRKVDLITTDGVSPYIKPFIDKEKILVYEA